MHKPGRGTIFKMVDSLNNKSDLNDNHAALLQRLNILINKFDDLNCCYHLSCYTKFFSYSSDNVRGGQMGENMKKVLKYVIDHILHNKDECQFFVIDILKNFKGDWHDVNLTQLQTNLKAHFGEDIQTSFKRGDLLLCFLNKFESKWSFDKTSMSQAERLQFIEAAAYMILEDIRVEIYDTSKYKSPTTFLEKAQDDIPVSLQKFLNVIVKTNKRGKGEQYEKKLKHKVYTLH